MESYTEKWTQDNISSINCLTCAVHLALKVHIKQYQLADQNTTLVIHLMLFWLLFYEFNSHNLQNIIININIFNYVDIIHSTPIKLMWLNFITTKT